MSDLPYSHADIARMLDYAWGPKVADPGRVLAWIEQAPTSDEDHEQASDAMDAAIGLYCYLAHHHRGQTSKEYALLCRLTRPGMFRPASNLPDGMKPDEDTRAIAMYEALAGTPYADDE